MNTQVAQAENIVKSKLLRALAGGFVGTVLFTLMGMFVAPKVIGQPMDVAALIAPLLGGSHPAGVIAHFVTGTIVFPIAYLVLGIRWLPGPGWLRGALFLMPLYLVAMVVVMPLLGHIVFGLSMGAIIGRPVKG
jgi:hypothetical protein